MERYWIIARSVTYAQRMEAALSRAGIRPRIYHAPRELSSRGCAYAVEIPGGTLSAALSILNRAQLDPVKLYYLTNGTYVELPLR